MNYTFEEWRDVARVFYDITALTDLKAFSAEATVQRHDRLICTRARFTGQRFDHDPARINGIDHNYLLYERYFVGEGRGLAADVPTRIDAARIHVIDMSRPYRSVTNEVVTAGICIPHDAVGYDPSRDPPYRAVPIATPQGRLLDLAHGAFRFAVTNNRPDAVELAAAFVALLRALMLKASNMQAAEQQDPRSRRLMRTYISRHLDDPDLSPAHLCRELGVSRSVLYREFQHDGGVARFITDRRLDQCFADLLAAPTSRGAVRTIAERWGFDHAGNFHRCFRDRFGVSPSECLAQDRHRASQNPRPAYHPVHEWLRRD